MSILGEGYQPVIDGFYMPDYPTSLYSLGQFNRNVDLMLGFTENEGAVFIFGMVPSLGITTLDNIDTAMNLIDFVVDKSLFRGAPNRDKIKKVISDEYLQGARSHEDFMKGLIEMYGDLLFVAPSIGIVNQHVTQSKFQSKFVTMSLIYINIFNSSFKLIADIESTLKEKLNFNYCY